MPDSIFYQKAVSTGRALLSAMQAPINSNICYASPSPWTSHASISDHGWVEQDTDNPTPFPTGIAELLQELDLDISPSKNVSIKLKHAKNSGEPETSSFFPSTGANHRQIFNVQDGTIFVADVESPREKLREEYKDYVELIPSEPAVLQHWSDITFLTWAKLASEEENGEGRDVVQNLQRVIHCNIKNTRTIEIMETVLWDRGRDPRPLDDDSEEPRLWMKKVSEEDGEVFLALLGTPNGSGVGYLLAQHKEQLGCKIVKSISIHEEKKTVEAEPSIWQMVIEIEVE